MLLVALPRGTGGYWRQQALSDLLALCLAVVFSIGTTIVSVAIDRFSRYALAAALLVGPGIGRHVARSSFAELGCPGRRNQRDAVQQGGQSRGLWRRVLLVGGARPIQGLLWRAQRGPR